MMDRSYIPVEYRPLVGLLRCAVNGAMPHDDLSTTDWPAVLKQAREQGVDAFLYPWLALHHPSLFSSRSSVPPDSAPAVWRTLFYESVTRAVQRQHQLTNLFGAFAQAKIGVLILKGAWLSSTLYDDDAQRTMSDLDILVRPADCDASHDLLLALGYSVTRDVRRSPYDCNQTYVHGKHPYPVELHWGFDAELVPGTPIPDMDAIWANVLRVASPNLTVFHLSPEHQLTHLVQHILHHQFALPLRGYLDLALLLQKQGPLLSFPALDEASRHWKVGRAVPFVLGLTSELFDAPLPPAIEHFGEPPETPLLAKALQVLFTLPAASARSAETTLLRYRNASTLGRFRLVLNRVFVPRAFLERDYPCARNTFGLPLAWCLRAADLTRRNRSRIRSLRDPESPSSRMLNGAAVRVALVQELLRPSPTLGTGKSP